MLVKESMRMAKPLLRGQLQGPRSASLSEGAKDESVSIHKVWEGGSRACSPGGILKFEFAESFVARSGYVRKENKR